MKPIGCAKEQDRLTYSRRVAKAMRQQIREQLHPHRLSGRRSERISCEDCLRLAQAGMAYSSFSLRK
jgi:hypothetical protein